MLLKLDHPANRQVLEYLEEGKLTDTISESPQNSVYARIQACRSKFKGYHPDIMEARTANECKGFHPDTMTYAQMHAEMGWSLNDIRSWVVYGRPVFFHPGTGVIFGVPKKYGVVWRLPKDSEFIAKPEPEVGDDWYIVTKHIVNQNNFGEVKIQAYDYAGSLQEDGIEARRGARLAPSPAPASSAPPTMPPTQPPTMPPKTTKTMLNPDHPANQQALAYLKEHKMADKMSEPAQDSAYANLGGHPDIVAYNCRGLHPDTSRYILLMRGYWSPNDTGAWVVYGRPVFVHPETGVIFGVSNISRAGKYHAFWRLPNDNEFIVAKPQPEIGDDWFIADDCFMAGTHMHKKVKMEAADYAGKLNIEAHHDELAPTPASSASPSTQTTRPPTKGKPTPDQQEDEQDETIRVLEVLAIQVAALVKSADDSTTALNKFQGKLSHRLSK